MLLVQLSRRISQPGQAYKMGILEKIVNGLKFILRLIWWIWRVYFVWTLGSVIQVIQLISTLKKLFVSYLSITWIMNHWIQGNNRILTITRITWITRFLFISCRDQSYLDASRNPVSMGLRANTSDKNPKPTHVIKHTSSLCEWLFQSVTQWLDQLDHQVHLFVHQFLALLESTDQRSIFPNK